MQTCFSCWLLTFSCCFWSGDPVVSEETWINPTRAAFFFFFEIAQSLITFLIAGTWRSVFKFNWLENYHDFSIREEKRNFSSPIPVVPSLKKKKEKEKKTVHSTNEDWSWKRYRLLSSSAGHSGIGLFCISTFFLSLLRIVVISHGNFNEQWAKTSHCFQTVRSRQLSGVVITRAYLATRKNTRKRREKKRKMNGVEINTRAYVATRLLRRSDYLYAVTLKTKVVGDYNHARLEVSWITSTRGLLPRGYTGAWWIVEKGNFSAQQPTNEVWLIIKRSGLFEFGRHIATKKKNRTETPFCWFHVVQVGIVIEQRGNIFETAGFMTQP